MLTSQHLIYEIMNEDVEYTLKEICYDVYKKNIFKDNPEYKRILRILFSLKKNRMMEITGVGKTQRFKKILR